MPWIRSSLKYRVCRSAACKVCTRCPRRLANSASSSMARLGTPGSQTGGETRTIDSGPGRTGLPPAPPLCDARVKDRHFVLGDHRLHPELAALEAVGAHPVLRGTERRHVV